MLSSERHRAEIFRASESFKKIHLVSLTSYHCNDLHSSDMNHWNLSASSRSYPCWPESRVIFSLSATPKTESASISFKAVGLLHLKSSSTSPVFSVPPFFNSPRKTWARTIGAESKVSSNTVAKSSASILRRPRNNACPPPRLHITQFLQSACSITGTVSLRPSPLLTSHT